jgi:hypothetical protein
MHAELGQALPLLADMARFKPTILEWRRTSYAPNRVAGFALGPGV